MWGCIMMEKKKAYMLFTLAFLGLTMIASPVAAAEVNECNITPKLASILGSIVLAIRILIAAALVVLTILDIMKVVIRPDYDDKHSGRSDIWKRIVIRMLVVAAIFFLPSIITLFFHMIGMDVTFCGIL